MSHAQEAAREFGAFLRSRRSRLTPATVGLPPVGVRRTAGLRRAEIAALASISPGYYQRLEQGRVPQPSVSVLDALAAALRLSDEERSHLFALAHQALPERGAEPPASAVRRMLDMLAPPTAAYVIDRNSDVLAWNSAAAALFPHLVPGPRTPNNVLFVFTDPGAAELFVDWPDIAADSVAHLRAATGHRPHDARLDALLRQLRSQSARFRELWEARDLRQKVEGRKELRHPLVGRLSLDYAVLAAPTAPGQRLVAYSADPGSPSHEALLTLGRTAAAPEVSSV